MLIVMLLTMWTDSMMIILGPKFMMNVDVIGDLHDNVIHEDYEEDRS